MGKYMDDFFNIDHVAYNKEWERYCRNREETEEVNEKLSKQNRSISR